MGCPRGRICIQFMAILNRNDGTPGLDICTVQERSPVQRNLSCAGHGNFMSKWAAGLDLDFTASTSNFKHQIPSSRIIHLARLCKDPRIFLFPELRRTFPLNHIKSELHTTYDSLDDPEPSCCFCHHIPFISLDIPFRLSILFFYTCCKHWDQSSRNLESQ